MLRLSPEDTLVLISFASKAALLPPGAVMAAINHPHGRMQFQAQREIVVAVLARFDRDNPGLAPVPHDGVAWKDRATAGQDTGKPEDGSLRVWWTRNPPAAPTFYPVADLVAAQVLLAALEFGDVRAGERVVSNVGGLQVYRDGDWEDWYDDEGRDFDEFLEAKSGNPA